MENRPTIRIGAIRIQPEYEERFVKWQLEVHHPLLITVPGFERIDYHKIVKENPQYAKILIITHYTNRTAQLEVRNNQRWIDITKDISSWANRSEYFWFAAYEQIYSRKNATNSNENRGPGTHNSPVIHIEGYAIPNEQQEKYDTWSNKLGREVYIPLITRLPGLREYTEYRLIDLARIGLPDYSSKPKIVEYPSYVSILTFDDIKAFQNHENSLELAALKGALQAPFPLGLNYQWYVQYQLVKSFRK